MLPNHVPVKVKRLRDDAFQLRRGSCDAGAVDVAYCGDFDIHLSPGQSAKFPTGWSFELETNIGMLILPRSGLSTKQRLRPMNTPGLLDPDYRGELFIALENFSQNEYDKPIVIKPGDYIAQLMFIPFFKPMFQIENDLSRTVRGDQGFGSTEARLLEEEKLKSRK